MTGFFKLALSTNMNKKEGTTTPTFLGTVTENSARPSISMIADTDSPMSGKLAYKRKIFRTTTAAGPTNYLNYTLPTLEAKPSNICFWFFGLRISDINALYATDRLMQHWIYQAPNYIRFQFDVKALISIQGNLIKATKLSSPSWQSYR